MRDPLLERILADPNDAELRTVWADALSERGDPRGELITLQVIAERGALTPAQDKRLRSLLAKHRVAWLGELAGVLQHREGLVFERGLLAAGQVQVKRLAALATAVGHPLWATVRHLHFCDHYAVDPRIVPLLAHPVMAQLRSVICVGENHVFAALAHADRALPITSIWTVEDHGSSAHRSEDVTDLARLPHLTTLGFTLYGVDEERILRLPVVRAIQTLGITSYSAAGVWLARTRSLDNLTTLELRRWWIPYQGPERSHYILRFTRGTDGAWTRLHVDVAGYPTMELLVEDLESLRVATPALESVTSSDPALARTIVERVKVRGRRS